MSLLTGKASDFLKIGAGRDDVDTVRAVLNEKPGWIARTGSHGRTMLWEAAYRGRASMVKYLLDRGADPRPYGYFPVRFCIWRDRHDRWTPSTRGASACPWNPRRGCRSWSLRPAGYRWRSPGRRSLQKSYVASMLWGTFRELFPSSVAIICTLTRVNGSKG